MVTKRRGGEISKGRYRGDSRLGTKKRAGVARVELRARCNADMIGVSGRKREVSALTSGSDAKLARPRMPLTTGSFFDDGLVKWRDLLFTLLFFVAPDFRDFFKKGNFVRVIAHTSSKSL